MRIVTLLTDFGTTTGYVGQMKGVILSMTDALPIDITHHIPPQNVREGAFILKTTASYFPAGTIHLAVVDPGVGSGRKGLIIVSQKYIFIGPDNGLLIPAAKDQGRFQVYEIMSRNLSRKPISHTFHGRDIFSPIAAHICNGVPFNKIGKLFNEYVDLDFGIGKIEPTIAIGKILHIDTFGNIITNIPGKSFAKSVPYGKKIMLHIGDNQWSFPFVKSYAYVKKHQILSTIGSSNFVEIAINQGNAAKRLSVNIEDDIQIVFS